MRVSGYRLLVVLAVLLSAACRPDSTPPVERTPCDGAECVVNHLPEWPPEGGLRMAAAPEVALDRARPGEPDSVFGAITGAALLPDGGWVMADAAGRQLHFFGPAGEWRRSVGRQGEGPGEYLAIRWMDRCWPERLAVLDRQLLVEVALDGTQLARRSVIDGLGQRPWFQACDGEGRFIALAIDAASWAGRVETGLIRPGGEAWIQDTSSGNRPALGVFPLAEFHERLMDAGFHPLARVTQLAMAGGWAWIGTADSWEIQQFDMEGRLVRRFRRPGDPVPLEADRVREILDAELDAMSPRMRDFWRGRLGPDDNPPSLPAYDAFVADAQGRLWVRAYAPPGGQSNDWSVFGDDGRWLGEVAMPVGFEPLDIGRDRILGVEPDALDQPRLSLYRLEGPGI